jgi:hypothetical protein
MFSSWNRWSLWLQSQSVSSGILDLPPQLGLEPAIHTSEALEEWYLNSSQRILGN